MIAHPQLQRHGALNRVSANDETKRVSARLVKHPRDRRARPKSESMVVAPICSPSTLRRIGLQTRASVVVGTSPARSPTLIQGGLVNRPHGGCLRAPLERRWSRPNRDASRGDRRASSLVSPFHRAPKRSSPSAEEPVVASRRRPAAERALRCRSGSTERPWRAPSAVCLHNRYACTNLTVTHSAGR